MDMNLTPWKLAAIGLGLVTGTVFATGAVVSKWYRSDLERSATSGQGSPAQVVESPAASPRTEAAASGAAAPAAEVQKPISQSGSDGASHTAPPTAQKKSTVPPQSVIEACNRSAAQQTGGGPATTKEKTLDVVKDAAIGALGGAAVGAGSGAIAGGGRGAGRGAAIGGLVGAGGGTLYGLYANKQHDEKYREAYASCMRSRGHLAAN